MKKMIRTLCVVAISLFAIPQQADAQFFKKLKEAAKEVVKETISGEQTTESTGTTSTSAASAIQMVTSASGVSIGNPGSRNFDIDFVEAVGNAASNTVTITLKATSKDLTYSNVRIGDNTVTGYDSDGNEYKSNKHAGAKNMPAGLPVKFELSSLPQVPATVTVLPIVYVGYYLNSDIRSMGGNLSTYIQLKNVPVKWQ